MAISPVEFRKPFRNSRSLQTSQSRIILWVLRIAFSSSAEDPEESTTSQVYSDASNTRPKIRREKKNPLSPNSQSNQVRSRGLTDQRQLLRPLPSVPVAGNSIPLLLPTPPPVPVNANFMPPVVVSVTSSAGPTSKNVSSATTSGENENAEISKADGPPIPVTLGSSPQSSETMETDRLDPETCYDSDYERLRYDLNKDTKAICMVWFALQAGENASPAILSIFIPRLGWKLCQCSSTTFKI